MKNFTQKLLLIGLFMGITFVMLSQSNQVSRAETDELSNGNWHFVEWVNQDYVLERDVKSDNNEYRVSFTLATGSVEENTRRLTDYLWYPESDVLLGMERMLSQDNGVTFKEWGKIGLKLYSPSFDKKVRKLLKKRIKKLKKTDRKKDKNTEMYESY